MSSVENYYKKDTKIWIPHPTKVWQRATILSTKTNDGDYPLLFDVLPQDSSEVRSLVVNARSELPLLCHSLDHQFGHMIDNLSMLGSPNEASVLHVLDSRFTRKRFFTDCGGVQTIFLCPCKKLAHASDFMVKYDSWFTVRSFEQQEPHIYSVAGKAYHRLERDNKNQSIIFTGKSGSGKSDNANNVIAYLVHDSRKTDSYVLGDKILAAISLLEVFGNVTNAKSRDSSRFGRYIQLQYDERYELIGAVFHTYLLDASRVVLQNSNEENFNIFHQLRSAWDRFPSLLLNQEMGFKYLRGEKETNRIDYLFKLSDTVDSMKTLGLANQRQGELFHVLSALLHLGNVEFVKYEIGSPYENCCYILNSPSLAIALSLLKVDQTELLKMQKVLIFKQTVIGENTSIHPRGIADAKKTLETLVRYLYSKLFYWLVKRINSSLASNSTHVQNFIGVLDLYGFESFEMNSFEQFCINYANETLEQHIIALQSKQLGKCVDDVSGFFQGDSSCIDLMNGLIDVINDETRMIHRSIDVPLFVKRLEEKCGDSTKFGKTSYTTFRICHFLDDVQYNATEFVDKNSYGTIRQLLAILQQSQINFFKRIVQRTLLKLTTLDQGQSKKNLAGKFTTKQKSVDSKINRTVLYDFQNSLSALTSELHKTSPHYVRCIKSNDKNQANVFDSFFVAHQLRAFHVVDTLKLSILGYPIHFEYNNFLRRYHSLCSYEILAKGDVHESCRKILTSRIRSAKSYVFGQTKIFLKDESVDRLEYLRLMRLEQASIVIQCFVRRYILQKRYAKMRKTATVLQRKIRSFLKKSRRRKVNDSDPTSSDSEQSTSSKAGNRNEAHAAAATLIQRHVRGLLARRERERRLRRIVLVQACVRRFLAQLTVRRLRCDIANLKYLESLTYNNRQYIRRSSSVIEMYVCDPDILKSPIVKNQNVSAEMQPDDSDRAIANNETDKNDKIQISVVEDEVDEVDPLYEKMEKAFQKFDKTAAELCAIAGITQAEIEERRAQRQREREAEANF